MVFLTMKTWLQDEVITNLDSTVIKRGWQENLISLPGRRSGLTCTARWSPASEEGSEHHEPSLRGDSASSLCLKVGGWTCEPVFETAGSQNPLQGTSAKLRTVARLVVSLVESLLVNNPENQAEVRSLSYMDHGRAASRQSSQMTGCLFFLLSQDKTGFFFFFFFPCFFNPCWRLIIITTTHFFW